MFYHLDFVCRKDDTPVHLIISKPDIVLPISLNFSYKLVLVKDMLINRLCIKVTPASFVL